MANFFPEGMVLPAPDLDTKGWWEAAKRHELVVQRCSDCGTFRHTPTPVCYECQSLKFYWHKVSGKGAIFSYINVVHPVFPALNSRVPFNVVVVQLADAGNARMVGNVLDIPFEEIYIGMPVEAVFEDTTPEITQVRWKRADQPA